MSKPQGCTRITSGSAAKIWFQSSPGEGWPVASNKFSPPAISTSSGIQLPPAINGSIHSIMALRGRVRAAPLCSAICVLDQTFALAFAPERAGDFSDVLPDVRERVRLEGYDLHPPSAPCA